MERWQRAEKSAGSGPLCIGEFVLLGAGAANVSGKWNNEVES